MRIEVLFIFLLLGASSSQEMSAYGIIDMGCDQAMPKLCPNNRCERSYDLCPATVGCIDVDRPLLCPSGLCVSSFEECDLRNYGCGIENYQRCADGNCRLDCSGIRFGGCPMEKPFLCPSGKCVLFEVECTDYSCSLDKPVLCASRECVSEAKKCPFNSLTYDSNPISTPIKIAAENMARVDFTLNSNQYKQKILQVRMSNNNLFYNKNSAAFKVLELSGNSQIESNIEIKQVSNSVLLGTSLNYSKLDLDAEKFTGMVFMKQLKLLEPYEFVRSFAFSLNIEDYQAPNMLFSKPIIVSIRFNRLADFPNMDLTPQEAKNIQKESRMQINPNDPSDFFCLGLLDQKTKKWNCHSRSIENFTENTIDFTMQTTGTFAVLFFPKLGLTDEEFCGFLCQYKKPFIISVFFIFPIILLCFGFIVSYATEAYNLSKKSITDLSQEALPFAKESQETKKEQSKELLKKLFDVEDEFAMNKDAHLFTNPLINSSAGMTQAEAVAIKENERLKLSFENQKLTNDTFRMVNKINSLKREMLEVIDLLEKHKRLDKVPKIYEERREPELEHESQADHSEN